MLEMLSHHHISSTSIFPCASPPHDYGLRRRRETPPGRPRPLRRPFGAKLGKSMEHLIDQRHLPRSAIFKSSEELKKPVFLVTYILHA